jgi:Putative endonuclease segE, GIY-YIG domain
MWTYKKKPLTEIPDGYVAFVYMITNLSDGRKYIGKKMFRFTRKVKGKRKRKVIDSDWLSYYGSNKELKADVETLGPDQFEREILHLCKSKGDASYMEAKLQFKHNALIREDFYNSWISCKIAKSHLSKDLDKD